MDLAEVDAEQAADEARLSSRDACWAAAGWYAERGLPVFPVNGKLPLTTHGFKDASTDQAQIDAWWQRWPDAGVAAPTGILYDVVDVDGPVGYRSFTELLSETGVQRDSQGMPNVDAERAEVLPTVLGKVLTPRGSHYLVPPTGRGNTTAVRLGIDYRGLGGYTVLPPSKIDGMVGYRWVAPPTFGAADA